MRPTLMTTALVLMFAAGCSTATGGGEDEFVASCWYENPFAGPECREYRGGLWDEALASLDCADVFLGLSGEYTPGPCSLLNEIGRCVVEGVGADTFTVVSSGEPTACEAARNGCETFLGGTFEPDPSCVSGDCEVPEPPTGSEFVPPYLDCRDPLPGEPAGLSEEGKVCTHTLISGSTEPGRYFPDYADCDVVRSQRPYYADPAPVNDDPEDPRLDDEAYMREVEWIRDQARSSACACCHVSSSTPDGPSVWDLEAGPLWIDTVSNQALAMLVGLTDSAAFGYYPAEENNGFDRSVTGLPTTDVPRLQAFGRLELERRGLTEAEARELPPFAPFFRELVEFRPEACPEGIGMEDDGGLRWEGGSARYISILEEDATSPGVYPNFDLPEGTLWAVASSPTESSMGCGLRYGEVPAGASQRFPAQGQPAELVSGQTYYLHVQRDMVAPITRCLFVAP